MTAILEKLTLYWAYPFVRYALVVGVLIALCSHRPGKKGVFKCTAKQLQAGIGGKILVDGVHIQPHIAPGVKVADGHGAAALGAGAGDVAAAGTAVAHGAGAAGAHLPAGGLQ